jgi:WD40 repeat protein
MTQTEQSSGNSAADTWQRVDRAVKAFEDAWQAGQRPAIEDYLGPAGPDRTALLRELVHVDLQRRLAAGERVGVEAYLERFPELGQTSCAVELERATGAAPHIEPTTTPEFRNQGSSVVSAGVPASRAGDGGSAEDAGRLPEVPGYEVLGVLGRGGMGVVYKARQVGLKRLVALKMIRDGSLAGPDGMERFRTEAEALARLQHPNIVQVFEVGCHEGLPFFSLEFCAGGSLDTKLAGTLLSPAEAAALVQALARAVQAAHAQGIVHRDLKLANILLASVGRSADPSDKEDGAPIRPTEGRSPLADCVPKVTDFGLAKRVDAGDGPTATGAIMGTPSYMAPEQAGGKSKAVGPAADIYALGAILYRLLTGRPPFQAATALETLVQVVGDEAVPVRNLQPQCPRDMETICHKCLHKEPHKRYPSAAALAEDLRRFGAGESIAARPVTRLERAWKWAKRKPALATLAAVVTLAVLGFVIGGTWFTWQLDQALRNETQQRELAEQQTVEVGRQKEEVERQKAEVEKSQQATHAALVRQSAALGHASDGAYETGKVEQARQWLQDIPAGQRNWEWHYRQRRFEGSYATLYGHTSFVESVAFSSDGARLASGSWDQTVKVWDASNGAELLSLSGHTGSVQSVAFSPDGTRLASGSADKTVKLWDARSGAELLSLQGHTDRVSSVAFNADGTRLASGGGLDRTVKVWDARHGVQLFSLSGHRLGVTSVAFSPDGSRLASGSFDKIVKVWDARSGVELLSLEGHRSQIRSVVFSPDGSRLASASWDETVKVWDSRSGVEVLSLKGHTAAVSSVAFSLDGARLASGSADNTVKLWDARSGVELLTFKGHSSSVNSVAFSPDGTRLASGSHDKTVKLWDARSDVQLLTLEGHSSSVNSVAFSPDGTRLASGSHDKTVKVWDARSGVELLSLRGHTSEVYSVAFSPDGARLASGSGGLFAGELKVWDLKSGVALLDLKGHTKQVTSVAFSPDGARLASASWDKTVKVWDSRSGVEVLTLTGRMYRLQSIVFSPDGSRLASGSEDKVVKVWDVTSGVELLSLTGHTSPVQSIAFSLDGTRLVSGSADRTVKVWDARSGVEVLSLAGHKSVITSVTFSPDGSRLASASQDKTIKLWDLHNGVEMLSLAGHKSVITSVTFSPDGSRLASASGDGTVKLWNASSAVKLLTFQGHNERVYSVAYSPDGTQLASASHDTTVKLWDASSGRELFSLRGHDSDVLCVAFSPDGTKLASGSQDKTVKVWDTRSGTELLSLRGHTTEVNRVAFSLDGSRLMSRDRVGVVRSWETATGNSLAVTKDGVTFPPTDGARHQSSQRLALSVESEVQQVDLRPPDAIELGMRQAMARFNPIWHREQAQAALNKEHWFAAVIHLCQLAEHQPEVREHWERLPWACLRLGDLQPALAVCDRLLQRDPWKASVYFRRAGLRAALGQFHAASADQLVGLVLTARKPSQR